MTLELMERILGEKIQAAPETNGKRKQYPYPTRMKGEGASSVKRKQQAGEVQSTEDEVKVRVMPDSSLLKHSIRLCGSCLEEL